MLKKPSPLKQYDKFSVLEPRSSTISVFDEENWANPTDSSKINVAVYHGSISGVKTDLGWTMEHGENDVSIFDEFDFSKGLLLAPQEIQHKEFLNLRDRVRWGPEYEKFKEDFNFSENSTKSPTWRGFGSCSCK